MYKHVSIVSIGAMTMMLQPTGARQAMLNGQLMLDNAGSGLGFERASNYFEWKMSVSEEEHREFILGKNEEYIKERGEAANDLRLCIQLEEDWFGQDTFVTQKWGK